VKGEHGSTLTGPGALRDALMRHAVERAEAVAVDHPQGRWTWAELAARVEVARSDAAREGARSAARVPVDDEALSFIPRLLAAEECLVPLSSRLPGDERARRIAAVGRFEGPSPGVIVHTSGTTGTARAVRLSYDALATSARMVVAATDLRPGDAWLSALPLHHVGGIGVVLRCVLAGATMVLQDRFDAGATAEALRSGDVTHGSFVARMLERALDAGPCASPALRCLMVGGGPTAAPLMERARAEGLPVYATYGMTEAASTVTLERPGGTKPLSAGAPLHGVSIRIADNDAIEVLTPAAMEGYDPLPDEASDDPRGQAPRAAPAVRDSATTTFAVVDDWMRTRDVGRLLPDGRLVVLDRRHDLIVSGGENVSPARVEEVLTAHPLVDEAAVVGEPNPSWGQRVVAVVRLSDAAPAETGDPTEAIATWARAHLAAHEVPKRWVVATEPLPRDEAGKLRRREVREGLALPRLSPPSP